MQIEIDNGSGFCFGVTTAIKKAEDELAGGHTLYCLGDIVHNGMECERLRQMGLVTINHDEMLTAFSAYDEAVADANKAQTAIDLLTVAHQHYTEITTVYTSLRSEAIALYTETNKSKFALRDSVKTIRTNIVSYYSKNEDHYAWVCEALPALRSLSTLFGGYKQMNLAISTARNQLKATDYDGRADLQAALSEAGQMPTAATKMEEFQQGIAFIQAAQAKYLKNRPSEWITIQNGQLWKTTTGATVQAHAPGFIRVSDIWYMCGEDRSSQWNPDVNLYSSTDLKTWKFEKKIVQNGVTCISTW